MSKQYLTAHTIDNAHKTDIFSLAVTSTSVLSASGTSTLKIHSTLTTPPSLTQSLPAHKLGCHHICTSKSGTVAASRDSMALLMGRLEYGTYHKTTGENAGKNGVGKKFREYETKGSFGLCVDISADGRFTASGHENGGVYVFNNDTGRMVHSLPGLIQPVRTLSFSPLSTFLAAAGDSATIALYSVAHGEQVANMTGHTAWIFSIDWSFTGEYLASGSWDGKVKVWSVEGRNCVATHSETDKALWAVKWLPKVQGKSESFVTAGANRSLTFYREATGG
ncbi:hypothetical protein DID88_001003 [Monilinia fructigena]|uniref:Uncharacterized protein n=1 Tax=Monilinia fructigena TaxID=38457 RepID=A0A395IZM8_9HELO|nr:hypothetical protein DID88_001003 [Monilinia fructigena]